MKSKTIGKILKSILIAFNIIYLAGGIYAASQHISGITWKIPLIIGVPIILYTIGEYLMIEKKSEVNPRKCIIK